MSSKTPAFPSYTETYCLKKNGTKIEIARMIGKLGQYDVDKNNV